MTDTKHGRPLDPEHRQESTLSTNDGFIPDDAPISPFDTDHPAIANLSPALRETLQSAATDAAAAGIDVAVNSGWRSARYQQALLDEAIVTYGSEQEARRWVSTPERSSHVTGDAIDVGPTDAAYWFSQYGNQYGLCQTYANEIWHYELLVEPGETCPEPATDASESP